MCSSGQRQLLFIAMDKDVTEMMELMELLEMLLCTMMATAMQQLHCLTATTRLHGGRWTLDTFQASCLRSLYMSSRKNEHGQVVSVPFASLNCAVTVTLKCDLSWLILQMNRASMLS